jgi:hypothetical protein
MNRNSFPNGDRLRLAARNAFEEAMGEWNALELGVTFKYVEESEPAMFQLVYIQDASDSEGETYARSFFPNTTPNNRRLVVYAKSFADCNIGALTNIFCHELGHILGLRHEFAGTDENELRFKSVQFGQENLKSVMGYYKHPAMIHLHELDIMWTKRFYAYDQKYIDNIPIVEYSAECMTV